MQESLAGKVTIITGAGSGIGRACADILAAANGKVVLADVNEAALETARNELVEGGTSADGVLTIAASVRSEDDMARMAAETQARFGRIDALVASAGILRVGESLKMIADTPVDEWDAIINTNLTGTFLSNRAVLPAMTKQRQGDIINISSTSGRQGRPFDGPYSASKFGIIGLSESLAEEVSRFGIRVQTILPDAVATPLWDQNGPGAMRPTALLPPERVAEFICMLLALPRDTYLMNPVIAPFKARRKGKKG